MIALINIGNSNIQSVINALDYLEIEYTETHDKNVIQQCDTIILPGVGTFGNGIKKLHEFDIFDTIKEEVLNNKKPILGICLGMQMLFQSSEESPSIEGLSLIKGKVVNLPISENYKIPRIGWDDSHVQFDFLGLTTDDLIDFYYIHSFYVKPKDQSIISISTDNNITSAIAQNNIYGCQFHPEKSHQSGLKILKTFAKKMEL